ncbi:MAG: gluconokinase [Sulfitobacter sp.]
MTCFVIMGVSGCGKTSVGMALSKGLGIGFVDGDDLHPDANIQKMAQGDPLNDTDRAPWLVRVGQTLAAHTDPIAVGCSALKKNYRDIIRLLAKEPVHFLHLDAPKFVLAQRVLAREDHFMPTSLLDSQFDALEPLSPDELGRSIDISVPFDDVVRAAKTYVKETIG